MSRLIMLLLSLGMLYSISSGQVTYTLSGRITGENGQALSGTNVLLSPSRKGITTNHAGVYTFSGLGRGIYFLEISYVGYRTHHDTIVLSKDVIHDVELVRTSLSLDEFIVSGHNPLEKVKETPYTIEIVSKEYLRENLGGSLMKSLSRVPGVTTIDIGSGQSKPVIRGLSFNRVVVVENGIKHEAQQWGSDHGLEVDQYALDYIEIIKGPASLSYGSDAIGGVVEIRNRQLPDIKSAGGTVDLTYKTNNGLFGSSISLFGRKKWLYAILRTTIIDFGDYHVPTDSVDIYSYRAALHKNQLRNTAGEEKNIHFILGAILPGFQNKLYLSQIQNKSGFFANAHGLEPRRIDAKFHDRSSRDINYPFQEVKHLKVVNSTILNMRKWIFESDLGFQKNFRQEWSQYVSHGYMPAVFPDTMAYMADLERQFDKYVTSGNLKFSCEPASNAHLSIGVSSEYQRNRIDGRNFIIPAFRQFNIGAYTIAKSKYSEKSLIQAGIRYDYGFLTTEEYFDWFPSPTINDGDTIFRNLRRAEGLRLEFAAFTWSLGYVFTTESWLFKANAGKSFRIPIAKELAASGVNYHRYSYEVGDPGLSPEESYQIDAGLILKNKILSAGVTPFFNYFPNYLYLNPSAEHDRLYGNGNQVFYYSQSQTMLYGGELFCDYMLTPFLQIGFTFEYVYALQLSGGKKGFTLPFSPPASAILNAKLQLPEINVLKHAYIDVVHTLTAAQHHIVPPEEPTEGYQVINLGMGGKIRLYHQWMNIHIQISNIFNTKYFNHTSYYRLINVPEPGRNVVFNISIPFSGKTRS